MDESKITYEGLLPLHWEHIDTPPDDDMLRYIHEHNIESLKQVLLLDEFSHTGQDDLGSDLRDNSRMERKIDLLLSLLGSMINKQQATSAYHVKLTTESLQWTASGLSGLVAQQQLMLQLYLHPYSVSPLKMFAEIREAGQDYCRVKLHALDTAEQELLQRYIFLNHRRQVAAKRNATSGI